MADIFISYAREDAEAAGRLAVAMQKRGWSVFWDRRIPAGRRYAEVIAQHMELARCVIALWSRAANESDWVLEEAEEARKRKILTPARIEEVEPPWGFRRINAADLIGWEGETEHAGFQRLLEDIVASIGESSVPASTSSPAVPSPVSVPKAARGGKKAEVEDGDADDETDDEMDGAEAMAVVKATPQRQEPVSKAPKATNPQAPAKPGVRMFEELKRGIQTFQPDASWALYTGKVYEGWWFLTDRNGQQLVRVKPLTNLLRVRIRKNLGRPGASRAINLTYGKWIKEDESSVIRDAKDVARVLKQIQSEWP